MVSAGSAGLSIAHEQHEVVFAISDRPRELRKVVGVQVNSLEAEMAQSSDLIEIQKYFTALYVATNHIFTQCQQRVHD